MRNKIIITLYFASIVLLAFAFKKWSENSRKNNQFLKYLAVNESFDLDNFIDSEEYEFYGERIEIKSNCITALYITCSTGCLPCINDIVSYNDFFKKEGFMNMPVQQFVIVLDSIKKRALRFIKTTEFITPVAFGNDNKYSPFLQSYGHFSDTQQLLLIHNNRKKVFFRVRLSKGKMTSYKYKQNLLNSANKFFKLLE